MCIGVGQAAFFLCAAIKPQTCTVKTWGIFKVKNTLLSYVNYIKDHSKCDVSSHSFFLLYDFDDGSKVVKSALISVVAS
jgi:hypothetical protein